MQIKYDPQTDILTIIFEDTPPVESQQITENVIVDYDENDRIVALEILDFSTTGEFSLNLPKLVGNLRLQS